MGRLHRSGYLGTGLVRLRRAVRGKRVAVIRGRRYPVEVISPCVRLHHRFPLSFREVEEFVLERLEKRRHHPDDDERPVQVLRERPGVCREPGPLPCGGRGRGFAMPRRAAAAPSSPPSPSVSARAEVRGPLLGSGGVASSAPRPIRRFVRPCHAASGTCSNRAGNGHVRGRCGACAGPPRAGFVWHSGLMADQHRRARAYGVTRVLVELWPVHLVGTCVHVRGIRP
jgi:hypothetical protein